MIVAYELDEEIDPDLHERDEEPDDAEEGRDGEEEDHVELPVVCAGAKLHDQHAREAVDGPDVAQNGH